jgi:hypothetical protein
MALNNCPSWPIYYNIMAQKEGEEKWMIEEGIGALTEINVKMISDEAELINAVLHRPMFSFLLIPSAQLRPCNAQLHLRLDGWALAHHRDIGNKIIFA